MVECHHQFSGHELGHTPGDDVGQGSLVCCSPQGCKESGTTERVVHAHKLFITEQLV